MPWKIVDGGPDCPFEVVKSDSGERVACHATEEKAKAHMAALYANTEGEPMMHREQFGPIERRDVTVADVRYPERIVTIRAVPYEQPAYVPFLRDIYTETFATGSMDHLIGKHNRVRVNRSHNNDWTVGKVVKFHDAQADGLIADIRIANTPLGDDTLALASEDCLSSSIGFAALPEWQKIDKRAKTRRIERAHLDHIAFVQAPAYDNADVISVREALSKPINDSQLIDLLTDLVSARLLEQRATPNLDQYTEDQVFRWADERLNKQ